MLNPKTIDQTYKFMGVFTNASTVFSFETNPSNTSVPSSNIVWSGITNGSSQAISAVFAAVGDETESLTVGAVQRQITARVMTPPSGDGQFVYIAQHPIDAAIAAAKNLIGPDETTLEPYTWAVATYPGADTTAFLTRISNHNGLADAARHTYWSCLLTIYTNPGFALGLTTAHEVTSPGPATETVMDLSNNLVGQGLGSSLVTAGSALTNASCQSQVINAIQQGSTIYFDSSYGATDTSEQALLQPTNR